jgi:hypothetical protein
MILFEELVDRLSQGTLRVTFEMEQRLCVGEFRKDDKGSIDGKKLQKDYQQFIDRDLEYFKDIEERMKGDVDNKQEKFLTIIFNHMFVFLEEIEHQVDEYITGYDGTEIIYNLYKFDEYYEEYLIGWLEMVPLRLVEKDEET